MIVLFNDIKPRGGGTYIAPDGIENVVKWCALANVRSFEIAEGLI